MTQGNGKGEAAWRLMHKPSITIPVAVLVAAVTAIFIFGQSTGDTEARVNAIEKNLTAVDDRIDRVDKRFEEALGNINDRLNELVKYLRPSRWDQR